MKRTLLVIIAATAIFASCQMQEDPVNPVSEASFTATIASTKTSLNASTGAVSWSASDQIWIKGSNDVAAAFTADVTMDPVVFKCEDGIGVLTSPYVAYYPKAIAENSLALPSVINYDANASYLPLYASSATRSLVFYNICGVVGVKVTSGVMSTVKKIRVSSTDKGVCGGFTITNNAAVLNNNDSKEVVLDCGSSGVSTAAEGTTFYVPVPANTYGGFKVELSSDGSSYSKVMNARKDNIEIAVNTIYPWSFTPSGTYVLSANPTVSTML